MGRAASETSATACTRWRRRPVLANTVLQQFQAIVTRPELAGV
ncbi:hypothetical protein Xclt_12015 [Xanthomonas axonopodis pv. clitoriae]|uniref:Uncharacterized protein n=2 Tax=Xanthomonas axonopodis TaxID=53413 RepID=A0ABX3MJ91_9XANT|nr:hypothetical protein AB890_12520 [Xanthomonas citri pv. citri]OOW83015.1 hypothetical protein Xclt_12015 [Xanthomonas axonopodis pv. clitoriae]OOX17111.1 hypothetical protein Xbuh_12270 [Xanthomonas axonopodis pv. bauhiniae]OOX20859.1 hypothetical protein Xcaj_22195 [Xanthomonas axonopodis pv. cajani]OMG06125.1 hypothetical protein LN96_04945 [Xanthomonas citri pv. citri]